MTRRFLSGVVLSIACAGAARAAALAANDPSVATGASYRDAICTMATGPVRGFYARSADPRTPVDIYLAQIQTVIAAYERCEADKQTAGTPQEVQYAQTRAAQFHFEAGHVERLAGEPDEARKSLEAALDLTSAVTGTSASAYYGAAISLRDTVEAEIALLPPSAAEDPAASPVPLATPT